jgi:uncharacterized membrane protein
MLLGLSVFLLTFRLGVKSLWDDEVTAVLHARRPVDVEFLCSDPYNPPLYFMLLHFWRRLGEQEWALRLPSVAFGVLAVLLFFFLVRRLADAVVALIAAFLLAISPAFLLYSREARAYSLLLLCSIASCLLLHIGTCANYKKKIILAWTAYGVVSGIGLATHYSFALLFATQTALAISFAVLSGRTTGAEGQSRSDVTSAREQPDSPVKRVSAWWRWWLASLLFAGLTTMFWLPCCIESIRLLWLRAAGSELFPIPFGPLGRMGYMAFVFGVGETLLPWRWGLVAPAALAFTFLFVSGLVVSWRKNKADFRVMLALLLAAPCIFAFTSHGAPRYVFGSLPFFIAFCAMGLPLFPRAVSPADPGVFPKGWRPAAVIWRLAGYVALTVITVVDAISLSNYFLNRDFHNMAYVEPTREVAGLIKNLARPRDVVVLPAERRTFPYYLAKVVPQYYLCYDGERPTIRSEDFGSMTRERTVEGFIDFARHGARRVWLIRQSHGRMGGLPAVIHSDVALESALGAQFERTIFLRFCEDQEAGEKRRHIDKPFVDYRIKVSLFE